MEKGDIFAKEYKKLNDEQKRAVETLNGPVMVVAGPGTGKTQILALRIANILQKTDVKPDGILCLTFTNSAVEAMQERLSRYIGEAGKQVKVSTFHKFGMEIIEKYFSVLGLQSMPKLLEETDTAIFFDEILEGYDWQYIRPRSDSTRYYSDLRSLISLLKRERINKDEFLSAILDEIKRIESSEESFSSRGENKGQLKKEIVAKLEGLARTEEVAHFIEAYEKTKRDKNVLDYDDVLENLVRIMEISKEAVADTQEQFLYVLIDEHQDSSRVQNEFLKTVWAQVDNPDIFVVGDDRQLIYGFSGASIDHFVGFERTFKNAKLITLVHNYRSTQIILDASHALLQSVLSDKKLISNTDFHHPIALFEVDSREAEIIACVSDLKEKIKQGVNPNECAILVPKNTQVREILKIIHKTGLPIASLEALDLFGQAETEAFLRVLKIISGDPSALAFSFFDKFSKIPLLEAHDFFINQNMREFSLENFLQTPPALFDGNSRVSSWRNKIIGWTKEAEKANLSDLIKKIGAELFEDAQNIGIVSGEEVTDTILSLLEKENKKNPNLTLENFIHFLSKLETYNEPVPIITKSKPGIKIITMHSSKGLEFDYVWIAHMDEWSLAGSRRGGFVLPETIKEKIEEHDVDAIKRKLYVAITRAKRFCTLSYSRYSKRETEQNLSKVIADLPKEVFEHKKLNEKKQKNQKSEKDLSKLQEKISKQYEDKYISASMLNNFFECPWKWYFLNFLGLPTPPMEILEFGSVVHASIDQILQLSKIPSEEEINQIIRQIVDKNKFTERIRAKTEREAREIIRRWVKNRLPSIALNRKNEQAVSFSDKKFPYLKIYGRIDLIEILPARPQDGAGGDAKSVRVTDFKTGSAKRKSEIEKLDEENRLSNSMRQLVMYSYLLSNSPKWNNIDVRESRLEFLEAKNEKESIYDHVVSHLEVDLLLKDIEDYDKMLKNGLWTERECRYNSYGKNTECEYCKMVDIYFDL